MNAFCCSDYLPTHPPHMTACTITHVWPCLAMSHTSHSRYDPLAITEPGTAGYGAGSGCPHVMFAFLKHCWVHIDRREAYHRWEA